MRVSVPWQNLPINPSAKEIERLTDLKSVTEITPMTLNQLVQRQADYSVDRDNR
jgi:hypothetical protein